MFRSYQAILRELSCLVVKLLEQITFVLRWLCSSMHLESGYVTLSLLTCLLRGRGRCSRPAISTAEVRNTQHVSQYHRPIRIPAR